MACLLGQDYIGSTHKVSVCACAGWVPAVCWNIWLRQSTFAGQVVQEQEQALSKGLVELAVTGAAFTRLQQSDAMEQLLFHTRIFARFAPDQKVNGPHTIWFSAVSTLFSTLHDTMGDTCGGVQLHVA